MPVLMAIGQRFLAGKRELCRFVGTRADSKDDRKTSLVELQKQQRKAARLWEREQLYILQDVRAKFPMRELASRSACCSPQFASEMVRHCG
jgi:hypothetical protein